MKIETHAEFKELLNFYFSKQTKHLKEETKLEIKNSIILSIEKLKGIDIPLKEEVISEFEKTAYGDFDGNSEKILFIIDKLSDEDKVEVLKWYINNEEPLEHYRKKCILLEMLDTLEDNLKIKILSKAKTVDILKMMSEFNSESNSWSTSKKKKAYCKNYYQICQEALETREMK